MKLNINFVNTGLDERIVKSISAKTEKMVLVHDHKKGDYYRKQLVNTDQPKPDENPASLEELNEEYSQEVEKDYSPWLTSLPKARTNDLNSYTSSRYMYINGYRRNTLKEKLPEKELKRVKSEINGIVEALNKSEVKKPITVYRRMEKEWLPKFVNFFQNGKLFEDPGFMSTTIIRGSFKGNDENGVPLNHLNENNGYVEMIINVPKSHGSGGYVRPISDYKSEFEFLLNCNSKFKITKIEQSKANKKVHFIHMDLVGRGVYDE